MNRYEREGIARDLIQGKTVLVLLSAAQQVPALSGIKKIIDDTLTGEALVDKMVLIHGRLELHTILGNRLVFRTSPGGLRGIEGDVVLDKLGCDPWALEPNVATGGELLR